MTLLSYIYGYGFGSNWLILVGIPIVIGLWAQFRVSSAFNKWGQVRASSNITGAEAALFSIDAASGALRFKSAPDAAHPASADGDNAWCWICRPSSW